MPKPIFSQPSQRSVMSDTTLSHAKRVARVMQLARKRDPSDFENELHQGLDLKLQTANGHGLLHALIQGNHPTLFDRVLHDMLVGGHVPTFKSALMSNVQASTSPKVFNLDHGLGFNSPSPLILAVQKGRTSMIKALLEAGANPNAVEPLVGSALHTAAEVWNVEAIPLLLAADADPNLCKWDRSSHASPLNRVFYHHPKTSKDENQQQGALDLLIAAGAEVNVDDPHVSPTLRLSLGSPVTAVKTLLRHGAWIDQTFFEESTLLNACGNFRTDEPYAGRVHEAVLVLIEAGADVHAIDQFGNEALHSASRKRKPEWVKALLDAGAEIDAQNNKGETPLMLSFALKQPPDLDVLNLLLAAGAKPNLANHQGDTALHLAVRHNDMGLVQALLNAGADPYLVNHAGLSPLQWSEQNLDHQGRPCEQAILRLAVAMDSSSSPTLRADRPRL